MPEAARSPCSIWSLRLSSRRNSPSSGDSRVQSVGVVLGGGYTIGGKPCIQDPVGALPEGGRLALAVRRRRTTSSSVTVGYSLNHSATERKYSGSTQRNGLDMVPTDFLGGRTRAYSDARNDSLGASGSNAPNDSPHREGMRDPSRDQNHQPSGDVQGGTPLPVSLNSLRDLTVESLDFWGQIRNRVLDAPDGCVVKDLNVAFSHRAQDPPSRSRRDDVPHYQNVQGCSQTTGRPRRRRAWPLGGTRSRPGSRVGISRVSRPVGDPRPIGLSK